MKNEFAVPGGSLGQQLYSQGHLLVFGVVTILLVLALYRWFKPTAIRALERLRSTVPRLKKNFVDSEFYAYRQLRRSAKRGDDAAPIQR